MRMVLCLLACVSIGGVSLAQTAKYQKAEAEAVEQIQAAWIEAVNLAVAGGHGVLRMRAIDEARVAGVAGDALREAETGLMLPQPFGLKDGTEAAGILEATRKRVASAVEPVLAQAPPASAKVRFVEFLTRALEGDPKNQKTLALFQKRTATALAAKDWPLLRTLLMRAGELDPVGYTSGKYQLAEKAILQEDGALVVRAPDHQLQARVVLPEGWSPKKKWPMFVAFIGPNFAHGMMLEELKAKAAKKPYILVMGMTISNGEELKPGKLPYSAAIIERYADTQTKLRRIEWDEIGLLSLLPEIRRRFSAEERFFMAGYGSGAFILQFWLQHHAEQLLGALSGSGNYYAVLVESDAKSPADGGCPVLIVTGSKDPSGPIRIFPQSDQAAQRLKDIGFTRVERRHLEGRSQEAYFELGLELLDKITAKKK
jgi:hypothetical protein